MAELATVGKSKSLRWPPTIHENLEAVYALTHRAKYAADN
jgi:hypothetical protein